MRSQGEREVIWGKRVSDIQVRHREFNGVCVGVYGFGGSANILRAGRGYICHRVYIDAKRRGAMPAQRNGRRGGGTGDPIRQHHTKFYP